MFATLEAKVAGFVIAAVLSASAIAIYTFHERSKGESIELAALKKSSAKLIAADDAEIARLNKVYLAASTALQEKTDETDKANAAAAATDADRVRQFNAYRDQLAKLQSTSAAGKTPSNGASGAGKSEDFAGELELAGLPLADALRDSVTALAACMTDRDSVTSK
jgi:hypothetical protein